MASISSVAVGKWHEDAELRANFDNFKVEMGEMISKCAWLCV